MRDSTMVMSVPHSDSLFISCRFIVRMQLSVNHFLSVCDACDSEISNSRSFSRGATRQCISALENGPITDSHNTSARSVQSLAESYKKSRSSAIKRPAAHSALWRAPCSPLQRLSLLIDEADVLQACLTSLRQRLEDHISSPAPFSVWGEDLARASSRRTHALIAMTECRVIHNQERTSLARTQALRRVPSSDGISAVLLAFLDHEQFYQIGCGLTRWFLRLSPDTLVK